MAISVKDIQEKEFSTQQTGGYNIEQVDDFLDEISDQMAALVRENLELSRQVKDLEADLLAAREAQAKAPEYDEKSYFQNLQNAMRESLIGAQRIADETLEDANRKAQKAVGDAQVEADQITATAREKADAMVNKAQQDADQITADAKNLMDTLEARYEALKASATKYKADFNRMLDQQAELLKQSSDLF